MLRPATAGPPATHGPWLRVRRGSTSQRVDDAREVFTHVRDRTRRIDDAKARGLGTRTLEIRRAHALEERRRFALELVQVAALRLRPRQSLARHRRRHV